MSHLIPGAPPQAVCIRCHRLTWDTDDLGTEDRMTQPDGRPCGGRFVSVDAHAAQDTASQPPYTHTFSFEWAQPRGWWDVRRRFRAWRRKRSVHHWVPATSTGSLTLTFTDPEAAATFTDSARATGTWGPTLVSGGPAPEGHVVGGLCHCGLFHPR